MFLYYFKLLNILLITVVVMNAHAMLVNFTLIPVIKFSECYSSAGGIFHSTVHLVSRTCS